MNTPTQHAGFAYDSLADDEYEFIRKLIYQHSRINLGENKKLLVMARLPNRVRANNLQSYKDYCALLASSKGPEELIHLIDAIATNHTYFFREKVHFETLETVFLPKIIESNEMTPIRAWCAGCSTGEESYSLAITLNQTLKQIPWQMDCSDISTFALEKARKGYFNNQAVAKMDPKIQEDYLSKQNKDNETIFEITHELKKHMSFHKLNLLERPWPFHHKFNIIFCRNVMIYFDKETKQELIEYLYDQLAPGGYLFIGLVESLLGIKHKFKFVQPSVFQKT
tara:strand:- start:35601 stop:36446 length:846 start_codon:yes stop_codon:yes gene_type:complete